MRSRIATFASILLIATIGSSQEFRGTVTGHVTDPQEAMVPNVKVQMLLISTGARYETITSANGSYTLPALTPGLYRVDVQAPGFKHYIREGIQVTTNERITLDIRLEVGQVGESVTITAEAPLLQTASASTGQVISERQLENMPLNGRTPMIAAQRAYGVIASSSDSLNRVRPTDNAFAAGISMGGAPQQRNELLIDGSQNTTLNARVAYNPPVDTVSEVKVESFQADAAYGHTGGGTVNVVLKGGTNLFHGSLYEYNQVSRLTAANFFNNRSGQAKANALLNQFGATVGGPMVFPKLFNGRNKLFFYGAWERMDNNRANPSFATVPTPAMRNGDLSALLQVPGANVGQYQIYNPFSAVQEGTRIRRQPFPNNVIPATMLSPIAQNYFKAFWKDPNATGQADGAQNFFAGGNGEKTGYNNELGRVDWNISDKQKMFINARRNIRIGSGANSLGQPISSTSSGTGTIRINWGSTLDHVYTAAPTMVVNTRLNFTRYTEDIQNYSLGFDMKTLGFPASLATLAARRPTLPRVQMDDFTGAGATSGNVQPFYTYQIFENVTKIFASHTLKFGADLRQHRDLETDFGFASGTYTFGTNWTRGPLDNSAEAPLGQDLAAFLLGLPTGGSWDVNTSRSNRSGYYALFVQDDWRVKRNLTLNFGLRWEKETPTTEDFNRTTNGFDTATPSPISAAALAAYARNPIPEIAAGQFKVNGGLLFGDPNNRKLYTTSNKSFGPRAGFAWTPGFLGGKTVLRGGTGVFYFPYSITGYNTSGFSQPTALVASLNNFLTPSVTLANPFPGGLDQPRGAADGLATFLGRGVSFVNPHLAAPYSIRWNFDIQQQLADNLVLTVGYMNNHAVHLPIGSTDANAIPAQYLSISPFRDNAANDRLTGNVTNPFANLIPGQTLNGTTTQRQQLLRPFPQFTGVTFQQSNQGSSYFHLVDFRLEKRFSHGLQLLTSYGFSRQMERTARLNPQDAQLEKRIGNEDRPHRFVASGTYDLPVGKNKALFTDANSVLNHIVGGWNVNIVYTFQSGPPVGWGNIIYLGGDLNWDPRNIDAGFDVTRFNRVSTQQLVSNLRTFPSRFANTRSDGVNSWDMSAIKNFPIWERVRLQFRFEAFNALNHARFGAANLTPTSSAFGTITSQPQDQPRAIQMALRLTW